MGEQIKKGILEMIKMDTAYVEGLIKKESVSDYYDLQQELGRGRFAVVKKCVSLATGEVFAAKIIKKSRGQTKREQLLLEIHILHTSEHPKLVRLYDVFEARREMILILEFANGGDLHRHCCEAETARTEKEIAYLIRQITEAVRYLHDMSVVHLDLKPDNILLKEEGQLFPEIRLIDFGLSRKVDEKNMQCDIVGTPEYVPPEVIAYDPIVLNSDMWSIGVVTYVLLTGISPFAGDDVMETYANIGMVEYDFDCEEWDDISEDATDFIEKLLERRPKDRMTAREALEHPWLKQLENGLTSDDVAAALAAQQDSPPDDIEACPLAFDDDVVSNDDSVMTCSDDDTLSDMSCKKESSVDISETHLEDGAPKDNVEFVGENNAMEEGLLAQPQTNASTSQDILDVSSQKISPGRFDISKLIASDGDITSSTTKEQPQLIPKFVEKTDKDETLNQGILTPFVPVPEVPSSKLVSKDNENIRNIKRNPGETQLNGTMWNDRVRTPAVNDLRNKFEKHTLKEKSSIKVSNLVSSRSSSFEKKDTKVSLVPTSPKVSLRESPKSTAEASPKISISALGANKVAVTPSRLASGNLKVIKNSQLQGAINVIGNKLQQVIKHEKVNESESNEINTSLESSKPPKVVMSLGSSAFNSSDDKSKLVMQRGGSSLDSSDGKPKLVMKMGDGIINTPLQIDTATTPSHEGNIASMPIKQDNSIIEQSPEQKIPFRIAEDSSPGTVKSKTSIKLGGSKFNIGPLVSMAKDVNIKEQTIEEEARPTKNILPTSPLKMTMGKSGAVKMNLDISSSKKDEHVDVPEESDKKLRRNSTVSRRRDSTGPQKNYRRLYVTKVRNSKIYEDYDVTSNIDPATAEIKARVENDVMKIEFVLKSTDLMLLPK